VTLIALTGLGTLGVITLTTVQSGISASSTDRARATALLAAESGVMVGMNYLNEPTYSFVHPSVPGGRGFSYVVLVGDNEYDLPGLPGNRRLPGQPGNKFSPGMKAWYDVSVKNNQTDPNFNLSVPADYEDTDGRIVFLSTGHGPDHASVSLEVEVQFDDAQNRFAVLSWREVE
jgi:hypothetical protein